MTKKTTFTPAELMNLLIKQWEGDPINPTLIEKMRKSFGVPKEMRKIIDRQCEYREQTHCYSCGAERSCLIFNGIAYLDLEDCESGIREIEKANLRFRNEDLNRNLGIGLTLIGFAYEQIRKNHRALREYEKALDAIKDYLIMHERDYDYIEDIAWLKERLHEKIAELNQDVS